MISLDTQKAIAAPADFTSGFTEKVDSVRQALEQKFDVPIAHDRDMNYSNGQKLCLGLGESGSLCVREAADYEIHLYVSSKATLFSIRLLNRVGANEWKPIVGPDLPRSSSSSIQQVGRSVDVTWLRRGTGK